ncbi:MAG: HNH endonuclease [Bacteroidia bacterium]|nr:HNH endonuclease [Bacteroidia bacterium]
MKKRKIFHILCTFSIMSQNAHRIAAFNWIKSQSDLYEDVIPRKVLEDGFIYYNQHISLQGPQGIWKPAEMELPLSITTVSDGPYTDSFDENGLLRYSYRGIDINHRDNVGLRKAMENQVPLIYLRSIVPGKYLAAWPVFIIQDHPAQLCFSVAVEEMALVKPNLQYNMNEVLATDDLDQARRLFLTRQVKVRLHQRLFRERVLRAYQSQCTLCKLRHTELLDAAHIIADSNDEGLPIVPNGLSLCKIHHAAFDKNIIGISPDFIVRIREDILAEIDGPMLKYGIQSLDKSHIFLPRNPNEHPDRDRLNERFGEFMKAG